MSRAAQGEKARAARRKRLVEHITNGLTIEEIADREGMDPSAVKVERRKLVKELGLKVWRAPKPVKALPFGITTASALVRGRLGTIVERLTDGKGAKHPIDVASRIGLTQTQMKNTYDNPSSHDWKLSQLERLAELQGKDFVTFMRELLR